MNRNAGTTALGVGVSASAIDLIHRSGILFHNILLESEGDLGEPGSNSAEYLFRTNLDFIV